MDTMPRKLVTITDEMNEALNAEAKKTRATPSALIRLALEELLTKRGYKIEQEVTRGGYKGRKPRPKKAS